MILKSEDGGFMAVGTATRDAEFKMVGEKQSHMCTWSIAAGKRKDTTTIFVNCKAWRNLADLGRTIKKGDSVCVIGTIEENEYNGRTYTTLVCEWLNVATESSLAMLLNNPITTVSGGEAPAPVFTDYQDAEGDLPFN